MVIITANKRVYINTRLFKKKLIQSIIRLVAAFIVLAPFVYGVHQLIKYPELYSTTAKYKLYNDIQAGNASAIEYYNNTYKNNNINLFDWKYFTSREIYNRKDVRKWINIIL